MEGKTDYQRPSWDDYFLGVMEAIAKRGTCDRGRSGCVIAKDKQIISAGYVGSAAGDDHCDDVGHLFQERLNSDGSVSKHCVRTVHAEQNAICQAARRGIALDGATLYMKMTPCPVCAKMVVNCGIKRVVCKQRYHDGKEAERLFKKCGVELVHLSEEEVEYSHKTGFHFDENGKTQSQPSADSQLAFSIERTHPSAKYEIDASGAVITYVLEDLSVGPRSVARVNTGIKVILEGGQNGKIEPLGLEKSSLDVLGGIITSDYRGEVLVPVANKSEEPVVIEKNEAIAKIIIDAGAERSPAQPADGIFAVGSIEESSEDEPTPDEVTAALEEENGSQTRW